MLQGFPMLRLLTVLIALTFATASWANCAGPAGFDALSTETQAALRAKAARTPFASGLLWQVEKDGITSYIVGTLHLPDPRLDQFSTQVSEYLHQTEQLLLEMTLADEATFQTRLLSDPSLTLIETGPTLIDRLGEENWSMVETALADLGIPGFMAARYQPWFLSLTLATPPCVLQAARSGELGLDRRIEKTAAAQGKDIQSMDTTDGLIAIFTADPIEEQVRLFKQAIESGMLGQDADPASVIELYFREEVQLIWAYGEYKALQAANGVEGRRSVAAQLAQVEQELVTDRNIAWSDTLVSALSQMPTTVAVGALHLPGDHGLLSLLEQHGFRITRLALKH